MSAAYQGHSHARQFECEGLLLQRRVVGESDLLLTLYTDSAGRISARARNAINSKRRFAGSLQPLHTLKLRLERHAHSGVFALQEAALLIPRQQLCGSLAAMEAAAQLLSWLRETTPEAAVDQDLWHLTQTFLDTLEAGTRAHDLVLAEHGLQLLVLLGWGLDFEHCVGCGKPCAPEQSALLSPHRGGLVCRACGGASERLSGAQRRRLTAAARGQHPSLDPDDALLSLQIVRKVLQVHGNGRS